MRELARARGLRPRGLLGLLGLRVRPADAARGRPPGGGQPRRRAAPRRPRGGLGGHALRAPRPAPVKLAAPWRRWRWRGGGRRGCAGAGRRRASAARRAVGADEPRTSSPTSSARSARSRAASPTRRSRRGRAEWDREHHFPAEVFGPAGRARADGRVRARPSTAARAPTSSPTCSCSRSCPAPTPASAVTVAVHTSAGTLPILAHGTRRAGRAAGPAAGPGPRARRLRADRGRGGLGRRRDAHRAPRDGRITGAKQWITNGSHAHTFLVFAREDDRRISACVVAARRGGLRGHARGGEARPELLLDRRPALRGHAGRAARRARRGDADRAATLDGGRIGIAAQAVGIAQAALDLATGYARERRAFGGPIGRFRAIQQKLADMQTEIEAARALTWRAARLKEAGRPHTVEGAQAKLFASRRGAPARPARRSRSSAATATRRSSRPSATTATPRSPRSTRARARSSGW